MIPYGLHSLGEQELLAVQRVMSNSWLTQGPAVPEFENAVADYLGVTYAIATCNGTSALHAVYLALGVNEKSEVWTTANTFCATSNAALMCGAKVSFVDIELTSGNICINDLSLRLSAAEELNQLPDLVTVVHFAGHPVDMMRINELSKRYGFKVVEDACHGFGAEYQAGLKVGNAQLSDATVFSFHPVKIITTAEGGMITTNSPVLSEKVRSIRSHGVDKDLHSRGASWEYDQTELGFNYRMTDIQAVIGLEQLKKVDQFISRRNEIADTYNRAFSNSGIAYLSGSAAKSAYHLYPILLDQDITTEGKIKVFNEFNDHGIALAVHYKPVYMHSYYQKLGFQTGECKKAEEHYRRAFSLPMYPNLTDHEQAKVIDVATQLLEVCL